MTGITLKTNIAAMRAQHGLNRASSALSTTLEQLASGQRINKASDDAAGLAIATQLNSRGRVFTQAVRNINDGVSAASIAEGALGALRDISIRQMEIAEQAANGTYSASQRRAMNTEANKLVEEFNRVIEGTTFNGMNLLDPALGSIFIQAGYGSAGALQLDLTSQLRRATGDGTFTVGQSTDNYQFAFSTISGDVNGDGKLDLLSVSPYHSLVAVSIGNGDGTFQTATTMSTFIVGSGRGSILAEDFNSDGRLDIATGVGTAGVMIHLGNGDGTFRAGISSATPGLIESVGTGDFNGDGKLDLLASTTGNPGGHIAVLLGNGNGTFSVSRTLNIHNSYGYAAAEFSLSVADFNNDGKLDIASLNGSTNVSVFYGNGNGSFTSARTFDTSTYLTYGTLISSADFDSDGVLDLLVTESGSTSVILLGNTDGSFKAARSTGTHGETARFADINADGRLDLIGSSHVFFGNGDGSFKVGKATGYVTPTNSAFALADFSGDGRYDFVTNRGNVFLGNGSFVTTAAYLNINTQQGARDALTSVTANLNRINSQLGLLGATTSRFSYDIANLRTQAENFFAAAGRIQDADIAAASANLVRQQITQQAAAAVLSQANLEPRLALKLLS